MPMEYTAADLVQNQAINDLKARVIKLEAQIVIMQATFTKNDLLARVEALEAAAAK